MNQENQIKAESGIQLLARLNVRQSAAGLEEKLFSSGPKPKETIEIKGAPSTGKTLLLTQFVMKSILPTECKNVPLGGLNIGVIFIETDSHFNLLKLVTLMEYFILDTMKENKVPIRSAEVQELIKSSLNNLVLLSCHNSSHLFVTFHSLPILLSTYPNISLILLDSVAAFYQQDVQTGGIKKIDLYCKKMIQVLQKCVMDYHVTIVYTKPTFFQSKNCTQEEFSSEPKVGKINMKINLLFHDLETNVFVAVVQNAAKTFEVKYKVENRGIRWQ